VSGTPAHVVSIGLSAAIVSVAEERPSVLVVRHPGAEDALPFGPFDPLNHRTLDSGLRKWVGEQTQLDLGYAEQLYTFGDRGRHLPTPDEGARVVSVGYLALTRQSGERKSPDTEWSDWYRYFPWEDWREARPAIIDAVIEPALRQFAKTAPGSDAAERRRERVRLCFGFDGGGHLRHKAAQAEFPPPDGRPGPGGRHRQIRRPGARPARRTVPLPPRGPARAPCTGRAARRAQGVLAALRFRGILPKSRYA